MRRRADSIEETRERIIAATVRLHGTVGPGATTIAGIAEAAGVTRLTVYRHFPDDEMLFEACTANWMTQQIPPDPEAWMAIANPEARLRAGLTDMYRFYRGGADMLTHVYHDFEQLPASRQDFLRHRDASGADLLTAPFAGTKGQLRRRRAVVGHAVSFTTWQSLCLGQGLTNIEAVNVMAAAVLAVA